jgi:asparagine synthase (glutamine-hydrolysing)
MCAIFGLFFLEGDYVTIRKQVIKMLKRLLPRGPDYTGLRYYNFNGKHCFIGHQRLSIVDPFNGDQPFYGQNKNTCSITNGEIYNHEKIKGELTKEYKFLGHSDCEIVPALYDEHEDLRLIGNKLSGMFATMLYDELNGRVIVWRDHMGIIPCYIGRGHHGELFVSSELKAFHDFATTIEILLPGHFYDSQTGAQEKWYFPLHYQPGYIPNQKVCMNLLREKLISSVKSMLMADVPFGVLLSGGLDSSLTASIASRFFKDNEHKNKYQDDLIVQTNQLSSFCIGLEGSPDLKYSREVANFLGTKHFEFNFTVEEGIDAVSDVIYTIETFNPTTIRSSTPMYLMARKIKTLGIKMVLTGEGADEMFGGYLYFHKAPHKKEFHEETVRKMEDLYKYDLLRANKSMAAWGVEPRVPFLDKDFVEYVMNIDPECKFINKDHKNIEKWVLREAFNEKENPWLPDNVLWRQKEQFSDGVGYGWIDGLKVNFFEFFNHFISKFEL